jgi:hypothetical protein
MHVLTLALVVIALAGFVTPVCAMPDCEPTSLSACSSVTPACGDCDDETVVMKHLPDEAMPTEPVVPVVLVAAAVPTAEPVPALVAYTVSEPQATGAPPPLDPLGVRLII